MRFVLFREEKKSSLFWILWKLIFCLHFFSIIGIQWIQHNYFLPNVCNKLIDPLFLWLILQILRYNRSICTGCTHDKDTPFDYPYWIIRLCYSCGPSKYTYSSHIAYENWLFPNAFLGLETNHTFRVRIKIIKQIIRTEQKEMIKIAK